MTFVQIVGLGLIICALSVILKKYGPEYSLAVSAAGGLLILTSLLGAAGEATEHVRGWLDRLGIPEQAFGIILKCLGIAYLAKIGCGMCADCGETGTAAKIELAAKLAILAAALPLFESLLETALSFMG